MCLSSLRDQAYGFLFPASKRAGKGQPGRVHRQRSNSLHVRPQPVKVFESRRPNEKVDGALQDHAASGPGGHAKASPEAFWGPGNRLAEPRQGWLDNTLHWPPPRPARLASTGWSGRWRDKSLPRWANPALIGDPSWKYNHPLPAGAIIPGQDDQVGVPRGAGASPRHPDWMDPRKAAPVLLFRAPRLTGGHRHRRGPDLEKNTRAGAAPENGFPRYPLPERRRETANLRDDPEILGQR